MQNRLSLAALHGDMHMLREYLKAGVKPDVTKARDVAKEKGLHELVEYLDV